MSLSTLLQAAEFLEQQEKCKELHRAAAATTVVEAVLPQLHQQPPAAVAAAPLQHNIPTTTLTFNGKPQQQTVVISGPIQLHAVKSAVAAVAKPKEQDQQVSSSSGTTVNSNGKRQLSNSFDIMNPLVIDEANGQKKMKRWQPPLAFRTGTREVHNKLEKFRRAHLKECFDHLKKQLPHHQDEKKTSNLSILHHALGYIQSLKRKERELEHEMEKLAREKIAHQQRLVVLKKDLNLHSELQPDLKIEPLEDTVIIPEAPSQSTDAIIDNSPTNGKVDAAVQPATAQLSVMPVTYPLNHQGLVLQKVLVPKGLTELPLMSTHFIAAGAPGKVVPLQYVVKPMVVVSTASRPS